jgi:hypothetical protein
VIRCEHAPAARDSGTGLASEVARGNSSTLKIRTAHPTMNTTTIATTHSRPNRVLVALATAWMILSLAVGGAVTAETRADAPGTTADTTLVAER